MNTKDKFNLQRFVDAQGARYPYQTALAELHAGQKTGHWIWFIFPQIHGLGHSPTSRHFAIKNIDEARAYLDHPILGPRLIECSHAVLAIQNRSAAQIFGSDDIKLRSSMTLFSLVSEPDSVFASVLDKYFDEKRDERTMRSGGDHKARHPPI